MFTVRLLSPNPDFSKMLRPVKIRHGPLHSVPHTVVKGRRFVPTLVKISTQLFSLGKGQIAPQLQKAAGTKYDTAHQPPRCMPVATRIPSG